MNDDSLLLLLLLLPAATRRSCGTIMTLILYISRSSSLEPIRCALECTGEAFKLDIISNKNSRFVNHFGMEDAMIPHTMTNNVESLLLEETRVSIITRAVLLAFNTMAKHRNHSSCYIHTHTHT